MLSSVAVRREDFSSVCVHVQSMYVQKDYFKMYAKEKQDKILDQQREQVVQLRRQAAIVRITVSKAANDLLKYIVDKQGEDTLLIGFGPNEKQNPYRKKSTCQLI